jgi:hypothetical protein
MLGRHPVGRHRTLGPGALRRRQAVRTALRSLVLDLSVRPRRRAQFSRAPVSLGGAGTFYSSQEKGNGAVSGKPGRSGRKSFVATTEQRNNVKILVGLGVPQAMICQLVVNPQTGKPLDEGTLKKHFPREIAVGAAELHARMGSFMVANIFGMTPPAGTQPIKNESSRAMLSIFFAKTRMGWKEAIQHEGKDGGPIIWQSYPEDEKL